jgi:hypothetical protein
MKIKQILCTLFSYCIVGLLLINITIAFSASSFSQNVGETHSWNNNGMIVSITITTVNTTMFGGIPPVYDTLYGRITQDGLLLNSAEIWLWRYNNTYGYEEHEYAILGNYFFIIPHNETAVQIAIDNRLTGAGFGNFTWVSGPNGYDGQASANMPNSTDPDHVRSVYKFNSDGVLEWARAYQGSPSGWSQFSYVFLIKSNQVPSFSTIYLAYSLALLAIAFFSFKTNKEPFKF